MYFLKKKMDLDAGQAFWDWFAKNEDWIIKKIKNHEMDVVWAVDAQITPVFPYWKKELEFQLGFNDERGELFFFHMGNKYLIRDLETLKRMMPKKLSERWEFIAEK